MTARLALSLSLLFAVAVVADAQSTFPLPAWIEVTCPAQATVTIQGYRMLSMGPLRLFVSPPLPPGQVFTYEVRAHLQGRLLGVQHVDVEAGKTSRLNFDLDQDVLNYGVDVQRLRGSSRSVPSPAGGTAGDDKLPDPTRRRLTVIGTDADRQRAREELAGPCRDLAADYVVQEYAPDHWAVAKSGFVTTGHPTIYAQEPDGRVLFRQDDWNAVQVNLEAVRKPAPDYKPDRDPDHRNSPGLAGWEAWLPLLSILAAVWFLRR